MTALHEQAVALLEDYDLELAAHPNLQRLCAVLSETRHFAVSKSIQVMLASLLSGMETYLSLSEEEREEQWAAVEGVAGEGLQALESHCRRIEPGKYTIN